MQHSRHERLPTLPFRSGGVRRCEFCFACNRVTASALYLEKDAEALTYEQAFIMFLILIKEWVHHDLRYNDACCDRKRSIARFEEKKKKK